MFSSRNLIFAAALIAILWATAVIGSRIHVGNQISKAQAAMNLGRHQQAIEYLAAADRFQPDNSQVQYMLAVAYRRSGQSNSFVSHLDYAQELGYGEPERLELQKMLYAAQSGKDVDKLAEQLSVVADDVITEDFPDQVYEALAKGYLNTSRNADAQRVLMTWISKRATAVTPRIWMATIAEQLKSQDTAEQYFREALEIDPRSVDAACGLLNLLSTTEGESEESRTFAENTLNRCLEESGTDPRLLSSGARFTYGTGDFERARQLARQALQQRPDAEVRAAASLVLGKLELNAGNDDEAATYLETAIALSPHVLEPYTQLALAYRSLGNNKRAQELAATADILKEKSARVNELNAALIAKPGDVQKMLEVADILASTGQYELAAGWWKQVVAIQPGDPVARRGLSIFYRRTGQLELADSFLQPLEAGQLEPSMQTSKGNDDDGAGATKNPG